MRMFRALAVAAVLPMLVAAKEPLRLQPSSKWVVEYADDSCRLIRTFGTGDQQALLVMERASPKSNMSMLVMGKMFAAPSSAKDFVAHFRPHEKVVALFGEAAKSAADKRPAVLWTYVSFLETEDGTNMRDPKNFKMLREAMKKAREMKEAEPLDRARLQSQRAQAWAAAAKVSAIEIGRPKGDLVVLETGSMGQTNRMMEVCAEQQLKAWGIDPEVEKKIDKPVFAPSVLSWFSYDDYPKSALRKGEESFLEMRLLIDEKGAITKCTPVTPVMAEDFGPTVCRVMRERAKFQPAKLADGTAVPSYYMQRIKFQLPR